MYRLSLMHSTGKGFMLNFIQISIYCCNGDYSDMVVLAVKCRVRIPEILGGAVRKVRVVAHQPVLGGCVLPWLTRPRHVLSFRFLTDCWEDGEEGGLLNLSDHSFTNLSVLDTYGHGWQVEVLVKSSCGVTLLLRRLLLGELRKRMSQQLHVARDFHMTLFLDFAARNFEVVAGGVVRDDENKIQGRK